jgi:flagellar hook assembly protein FlgD
LITQFPVQQGAPILTVKDENQILTKIIVELEIASLTAEQRHVLEQLKQLIGQQPLTDHTALLQNYPNPFNPETWIPYKLAKDASVTVRIYNVKGQLIRILHLSNKDAGVYMAKDKAAHWDGKDSLGQSVASGVYFYTLQVEYPDRNKAGIFTATRKMVIVK